MPSVNLTFIVFILTFPLLVLGQGEVAPSSPKLCHNGSTNPEKKFIKDFETSKEPMLVAYRNWKKSMLASKIKQGTDTALCEPENAGKKNLTAFEQIANFINNPFGSDEKPPTSDLDASEVAMALTPLKGIKKECIEASLDRKIDSDGYSCESESASPQFFKNTSKDKPCIDDEMLEYMQFTINSAIACLSPPDNPLDARVLLKKINNESGFNFYLAKNIGVGIGQLTSAPVKDITGWYTNKNKFMTGSATEVLKDLMANPNPHCKPFQEILKNESNFPPPPPYPGSKKNYCYWVSPERGLPRSLIYGIGFFLHNRDKRITPSLRARSEKLAANPDVINDLTMISYGRHGVSGSKSWMQKLRMGRSSNPDTVIKGLGKNAYIRETENKMGELLNILKKDQPDAAKKHSASEMKGDLCIQE